VYFRSFLELVETWITHIANRHLSRVTAWFQSIFYSWFDAMYLFANSLTVDTIACQHTSQQLVAVSGCSCEISTLLFTVKLHIRVYCRVCCISDHNQRRQSNLALLKLLTDKVVRAFVLAWQPQDARLLIWETDLSFCSNQVDSSTSRDFCGIVNYNEFLRATTENPCIRFPTNSCILKLYIFRYLHKLLVIPTFQCFFIQTKPSIVFPRIWADVKT